MPWSRRCGVVRFLNADQFNTANNQTCAYSSDDLGRLASVNCGAAWSQTFTYNGDGASAFGNLRKSGSTSFQPTYDPATNRIAQLPGPFVPSYDANGNLQNDSLHSYAWDANGNAITMDGVGATYDALDRMVEQNRSGSYTQIVYAPTGSKLALMNAQSLQKAFVPLPGMGTAVYTASGLAYYRHADWLGSSRFASTPGRTMYSDAAYSPFGEPYAQAGTSDLSFTGENQDTVPGLYDFPFREYATQGRWPSPDPAGLAAVSLDDPRTWNRYAYVLNDPLTRWDDGMSSDECNVFECPPAGLGPSFPSFGGWSVCPAMYSGCYMLGPGIYVGLTGPGTGYIFYQIPYEDSSTGWGWEWRDITVTSSNTIPNYTTIGRGDPNAKKNYCGHQADLAALEELLPGITRGDYVSTASKVGRETGAHLALEGAAASSVVKRGIRARFGVPMSITSKILGRVSTALLVYSGYEALRAAQEEYKACMDY